MSINVIMENYRAEKIPDIVKDYRQMKTAFGGSQPDDDTPWWSGDIVKEAVEKNYLCAKSLTAMAVLNGPTDVSELVSAWRQIKSGFKNKTPDGYDPKIGQHPFSFFRGTVLHEYLNPNSEKCINKELAKKIIKSDVSLRDTKFGKWVLKKLGVGEDFSTQIPTNIKDMTYTEKIRFMSMQKYLNQKIFLET